MKWFLAFYTPFQRLAPHHNQMSSVFILPKLGRKSARFVRDSETIKWLRNGEQTRDDDSCSVTLFEKCGMVHTGRLLPPILIKNFQKNKIIEKYLFVEKTILFYLN